MIPVLWRYAAASYLKTFLLIVGTFVLVLFVSRFKEIARFAILSSDPIKMGLFAVYQIPFILPMAIPFSALISAFLFFQRISRSHELTALRASGLSLKKILTPIILSAAFLTLINFSICANLAPFCQREARTILFQEASANPFLVLKKRQAKIKNAFLRMKVDDKGTSAENFVLVTYNAGNERLNLVSAKDVFMEKGQLHGQDVSIVSHLAGEKNQFDPLVIETQESMAMSADIMTSTFSKKQPRFDGSSLSFRMLRSQIGGKSKAMKRAFSEMFRRSSFSLSVLSLTLLGSIFSIEHARSPSRKNLLSLVLLTLLSLSSYFLGKSLKYIPILSAIVYFIPHLLIWISCYWQARRISKGNL